MQINFSNATEREREFKLSLRWSCGCLCNDKWFVSALNGLEIIELKRRLEKKNHNGDDI